jgi:hypothetical protein
MDTMAPAHALRSALDERATSGCDAPGADEGARLTGRRALGF